MNTKRGFITIALGDHFIKLARYLFLSYLYNFTKDNEKRVPFAVITDEKGAKELDGLFDIIIKYKTKDVKGYLCKLELYDYSPFDNTIFIDADSLLIHSIDDWFEKFEESGQDFAVWGQNLDLKTEEIRTKIQNNQWKYPIKTIKKYGLNRSIGFNGGVYYFKKSIVSKRIFDYAKKLVENYIEDGFHLFANNSMGDEPVMEISMIQNGIYAIEDPNRERMYCTPGMSKLKIDVLKHICGFLKYGRKTFPALMHWGTDLTRHHPIYERETLKLRLAFLYPNVNIIFISFICNCLTPLIYGKKIVLRAIKYFNNRLLISRKTLV